MPWRPIGVALYFALSGNQDVLAVLSFGYGILQKGLELTPRSATYPLALVLLAVALGKIATTALTSAHQRCARCAVICMEGRG